MLTAERYPGLHSYNAMSNYKLLEIHRSKISLHRAKVDYSYPTIRLPYMLSKLAGLPTGTGGAPGVVLHIPCSLTIYERLCVAVGDKDDSGSIFSFTCLSVFNSSASWPAFQGSTVSPVLRCTNRSAWA
jgi:hypothetical protein